MLIDKRKSVFLNFKRKIFGNQYLIAYEVSKIIRKNKKDKSINECRKVQSTINDIQEYYSNCNHSIVILIDRLEFLS